VRVLVAACVLLAGCERDGQPQLWRPPHVGDRSTGYLKFTANIEGPDGKTHALMNESEFTSEILAVDTEFPTTMRMTITKHGHSLDGTYTPGISGAFDMHNDGTKVDVTHADGSTLSPAEQEFFKTTSPPTRATSAAFRRFALQTFKPGQHLKLTQDEVIGLGFGPSEVDLTVSSVNADQITFGIKTVGKLDGIGAALEATGTMRVFRGGKELTQDGEVKRDGKRIGDLHVEQRSRPL
jgi:hypothetical protein